MNIHPWPPWHYDGNYQKIMATAAATLQRHRHHSHHHFNHHAPRSRNARCVRPHGQRVDMRACVVRRHRGHARQVLLHLLAR
eukprot:366122-Chlamydomonas_euryale.AAC.11